MRKHRVSFAALAAAAMLTACVMDGDDMVNVTESETTQTAAETAVTTAKNVTETVTTTETAAITTTAITTTAVTTTAETTAAPAVTASPSYTLAVIRANEVYEIYPTRIIYPAKTETGITAEKVEISEKIKNKSGLAACDFSAEYPVFSGGDEAVMRKINEDIKKYIDGVYDEEKKASREDDTNFDEDMASGYLWRREISVGSSAWNENTEDFYTVCGNVLSVRFTDSCYWAGAAHGMYGNVILNYDLRTGESIDFNDYLSDAKGLRREFYIESRVFFYKNEQNCYRTDIEKFANKDLAEAEENDFYRDSEEDGYFYKENVVAGNGCVGIYLAPYEMGSFASGVRIIEIPIEKVLPYLTDEGKALFEGAVSAKYEDAE